MKVNLIIYFSFTTIIISCFFSIEAQLTQAKNLGFINNHISIPEGSVNQAMYGAREIWSCGRYDGVAACFAMDNGRDKRDRYAAECKKAKKWSYRKTLLLYYCWCYQCI